MSSYERFMPGRPPIARRQIKGIPEGVEKPYPDRIRIYNRLTDALIPRDALRTKERIKPDTPLTGNVSLSVVWAFPCDRRHTEGERRDANPETFFLQKELKLLLYTWEFLSADANICKETCTRTWSKEPGIFFRIEELDE